MSNYLDVLERVSNVITSLNNNWHLLNSDVLSRMEALDRKMDSLIQGQNSTLGNPEWIKDIRAHLINHHDDMQFVTEMATNNQKTLALMLSVRQKRQDNKGSKLVLSLPLLHCLRDLRYNLWVSAIEDIATFENRIHDLTTTFTEQIRELCLIDQPTLIIPLIDEAAYLVVESILANVASHVISNLHLKKEENFVFDLKFLKQRLANTTKLPLPAISLDDEKLKRIRTSMATNSLLNYCRLKLNQRLSQIPLAPTSNSIRSSSEPQPQIPPQQIVYNENYINLSLSDGPTKPIQPGKIAPRASNQQSQNSTSHQPPSPDTLISSHPSSPTKPIQPGKIAPRASNQQSQNSTSPQPPSPDTLISSHPSSPTKPIQTKIVSTSSQTPAKLPFQPDLQNSASKSNIADPDSDLPSPPRKRKRRDSSYNPDNHPPTVRQAAKSPTSS